MTCISRPGADENTQPAPVNAQGDQANAAGRVHTFGGAGVLVGSVIAGIVLII